MIPHYADDWLTVYAGDALTVLRELPAASVHCCVTSPPYWGLRDYGQDGQLGLEPTPEQYVANLVAVFREVRRVLRDDGTLWLNLGDSYGAGGGAQVIQTKNASHGLEGMRGARTIGSKQLVGIPWRVAFALQADGWYLRSDIIWAKPNPMPESVTDRPTKSHEYVFLLSKSARYYYDADAIREPLAESSIQRVNQATFDEQEGGPKDYGNGTNPNRSARKALENFAKHTRTPAGWNTNHDQSNLDGRYPSKVYTEPLTARAPGRNKRSVWIIPTVAYPAAHFATFPPALVEPCVLAGAPVGGVMLDPFAGTGTAGLVANRLSRRAILIDLNLDYLEQQMQRNAQVPVGL